MRLVAGKLLVRLVTGKLVGAKDIDGREMLELSKPLWPAIEEKLFTHCVRPTTVFY